MPLKLYKKDSKNKLRVWLAQAVGSKIIVTHGLDTGQLVTETTEAKAKNVGRSNATTPEQQALIEVAALYVKKQERDGYKSDLSAPDKFIAPMLARDYTKVPHQVPNDLLLYLSPKLDGVRCIWNHIMKRLVSRKGTVYSLPSIEAALQDFPCTIDGEIYLHGYFLNQIVAATKKPNGLTPRLQFHVFDAVSDSPYDLRIAATEGLIKQLNSPFVRAVPYILRKRREIIDAHNYYVQQGYEGVMIRIAHYPYQVGIRSASLFKYKEFEDAEFPIVDVLEDKEGGAVLQCHHHGVEFKVRCRGTDEYRQQQLQDRQRLIGKVVTVRYQTMTEFGSPQFPVGITIRDYE